MLCICFLYVFVYGKYMLSIWWGYGGYKVLWSFTRTRAGEKNPLLAVAAGDSLFV